MSRSTAGTTKDNCGKCTTIAQWDQKAIEKLLKEKLREMGISVSSHGN